MSIKGYMVVNVLNGIAVANSSANNIFDYLFDSPESVYEWMKNHTFSLADYVIVPVHGKLEEFKITSQEI